MAEKLAHAYELLVPDQVRPIRADAGHPAGNQEVLTDETGGIVRACIVRSPEENHTISSQLAALVEYADNRGYLVPPEWRFQDEGYSGATLLRPGLEALRDLAAAGHIQAVLVFSPDRLSRKYAYQVLLTEELSRYGVEVVFLKAPSGETPEDQLLVQFQGNDRRIRAGADCRAVSSGQAPPRAAGIDQRFVGRPLWLSLYQEE